MPAVRFAPTLFTSSPTRLSCFLSLPFSFFFHRVFSLSSRYYRVISPAPSAFSFLYRTRVNPTAVSLRRPSPLRTLYFLDRGRTLVGVKCAFIFTSDLTAVSHGSTKRSDGRGLRVDNVPRGERPRGC